MAVPCYGPCVEHEPASAPRVPRGTLANGTLGAMRELVVCADLLSRGFDVFRAVSPSCSFDLVAHRSGRLYRVEVSTGFARPDGSISHSKRDTSRFDLLGLVLQSGDVAYQPGIETL